MEGKIEAPKECKQEYIKEVCDGCPLNEFTMVGHPGGSSTHSVEKHWCELGYWEEDF
jgi:hypothetical protein